MGCLRFVYGDLRHAGQHGFALVGIKARIGGDKFVVDADAGTLCVTLLAGIGI